MLTRRRCPCCHKTIARTTAECPYCGHAERTCPYCGGAILKSAKRCPHCNSNLSNIIKRSSTTSDSIQPTAQSK